MCVCLCVHVATSGFIHRYTHQSRTQKPLTLYPPAKWGETVEGELPGPKGDYRDTVRNKACLLGLPMDLKWGRKGKWQPHAVNHTGAAFIETRALLGLSQLEPVEDSLLHREPFSSLQGTA